MSEGNEVSLAGLEKEIIAVKSENTIFSTVQQSFSTDRAWPAIGRLRAFEWDLRTRNDYYITKMYIILEKNVAFGMVWLQLYDKTTHGMLAA